MDTLVQWWLLVHIFSFTGFSQVGQQMPMSITSASEPIQPGRFCKNDDADVLQFGTLNIPFSHLQVRLVEQCCVVCV